MEEEILSRLAERLNQDVSKTIKETLEKSVAVEVQKALSRAINDGEFYQSISTDIKEGLEDLVREMRKLRRDTSGKNAAEDAPGEAFNQTAIQLEDIHRRTENATFSIMDIVERQMEALENQRAALKENTPSTFPADAYLNGLQEDFIHILTALSFQDLIGQKMHKVILFIRKVEEIINRLYVSHNLMLQDKEANPEKNSKEIREEVQHKISQENIDALLSEYGID
ncbi:protein phosphatase CheZ [Desulfobotulus sp.]|jgi:chemotaxis protein CheZ|uniref:protein phosphatase CheZ n=1 Tax=Desulfobotulus sp. TaxID=1940337 RepID=UPI002A36F6B7|nr:protein phosphatase CheZ [Desulfobotulus sp.]MDY0161830.1 protein phosphatase CheZ [Desulfobotulus sp.]